MNNIFIFAFAFTFYLPLNFSFVSFFYLFLWISTLVFIYVIRFGGRQVHASEDDGSINHAAVRDLDEDAMRLEQFGTELEGE